MDIAIIWTANLVLMIATAFGGGSDADPYAAASLVILAIGARVKA